MKVLRSIFFGSDPHAYLLAFNHSEFLHLYRVICSILSEDNSDKFLVDLEYKMNDLL